MAWSTEPARGTPAPNATMPHTQTYAPPRAPTYTTTHTPTQAATTRRIAAPMSTPQHTLTNRRNGYRLRYPAGRRPVLSLEGRRAEVLDISEQGIRFARQSAQAISVGQFFVAIVEFAGGHRQTVFGSIVRATAEDIAARLYKGFEFNLLAEEHASIMA